MVSAAPGSKVILGVDTLADAASVASAVTGLERNGMYCVADEEHNGMAPGMAKHFAVARIKFAFARHRGVHVAGNPIDEIHIFSQSAWKCPLCNGQP